MDSDLLSVVERITDSQSAEDLFGAVDVVLPPEKLLALLDEKCLPFRQATDAERYFESNDREAAEEARRRLEVLYEDAAERIQLGVYGLFGRERARPARIQRSFVLGANRYYVGDALTTGERCLLSTVFVERRGVHLGEAVVKLVREPAASFSALREVEILARLHSVPVPQWKHLPFVLDRFETKGRTGLVLRRMHGATLADVRRYRPHADGIDIRDAVWMLDRILSCLGYVHRRGIVHGRLTPEHVMLNGPDHNAFIVGWGGAVQDPAVTRARIEGARTEFTAPEILDGGQLGRWTDLYSVGKLFIWLLGGDPETNRLPEGLEQPFRELFLRLVEPRPEARPDDAWEIYQEQVRIKRGLWKTAYRYFPMPDVS